MCAGRGECSCGVCVCSSSMLDDSAALYRGSGCECPPEEEICLNPEDGVSISCDNYTFSYCNGYNKYASSLHACRKCYIMLPQSSGQNLSLLML